MHATKRGAGDEVAMHELEVLIADGVVDGCAYEAWYCCNHDLGSVDSYCCSADLACPNSRRSSRPRAPTTSQLSRSAPAGARGEPLSFFFLNKGQEHCLIMLEEEECGVLHKVYYIENWKLS